MSNEKNKVIRIIDANYNRAKEALRVCEDVARFILEKKNLTAKYKRARHDLTTTLLSFPVSYKKMIIQRDASGDVGRSSLKLDKKKITQEDIFLSNIQRSQEAVRVLEEWAKTLSVVSSKKFQRLRFKLYDLEKETIKLF